ncbi:MAG: HEPN domain-containing protein [Bacteroidetes bacterium]|nr:HEPN domain-containing protein [Bacteroidota bacterium]
MQSFRTELENITTDKTTLVERDIIDLEEKIRLFRNGTMDPEKFRSLRLARGVYGQRQQGVQMVRIKIPYGKISPGQLRRIASLSDEFSNGNLHLTTRQDIQLHHISLDDTPELWEKLERGYEEEGITLREACGNTVRNVTASPSAGIDPEEPFDVTPYADELFRYFLRNPVGQDLGRKIKIAFSSSEKDSAFTFIHDFGFIPRVEISGNKIIRGFKVLIGGGLGAQPFPAETAFEFLPANEIIPFTESVLRVFDRYGERNNRHKARLKYLVDKIGLSEILRLAAEERKVPGNFISSVKPAEAIFENNHAEVFTTFRISGTSEYSSWLKANVWEQKQKNSFAAGVKIPQGNISSVLARKFSAIAERYASKDIRITPGQSFLLRFIPKNALPALFHELKNLGLASSGSDALGDITSCPGTDTCNLGISNSTGVSAELEKIISEEFPHLVAEKNIRIRISGCINSCGQHGLAQIGFHGSSQKAGEHVIPALQLLLGGGATGSGPGRIAEKVIKFPSKRAPAVLRILLSDFEVNSKNESFNDYYDRAGKNYFYHLLKPVADTTSLSDEEFIDWGQETKFETAIGTGECAGVKIDLVSTLLFEAKDALAASEENFNEKKYSDALYTAYNAFIHAAKALLLDKNVLVNTHHGVLSDFEKNYGEHPAFRSVNNFSEYVLRFNRHAATELFARIYLNDAKEFVFTVENYREQQKELSNLNLN